MRLRSDPAGVAYSTLRLSIAGLKGPLCGREGRAGWRGEDGNSGRDSKEWPEGESRNRVKGGR